MRLGDGSSVACDFRATEEPSPCRSPDQSALFSSLFVPGAPGVAVNMTIVFKGGVIMDQKELVSLIVSEVVKELKQKESIKVNKREKEELEGIKVGISARHVHLSQEDLETLFGKGYQLTKFKELMGDEFAAKEQVTLVGPSLRSIENVRVLGPVRKNTQVEIAKTDAIRLGVNPPVRPSGEIAGSERIVIVGPRGVVHIKEGCIIANRHIHMTPADAQRYGLKDNDYVDVETRSCRPALFCGVQVRVHEKFNTEMHIDTDDGNAVGIKTGDIIKILGKSSKNRCGIRLSENV
ncbi:MAG: putative phosphotransacetylase [Petroclostridium sp.]|nr:Propanediol utilization protein [Clostridia bacterium]MDK2810227.1 putative phosphotransacetylase [Petroclostridium sp.]